MSYRAYICEGCERPQLRLDYIWNCPGCHKEICETCFDRLSHCKGCSKGKTETELIRACEMVGIDQHSRVPLRKGYLLPGTQRRTSALNETD